MDRTERTRDFTDQRLLTINVNVALFTCIQMYRATKSDSLMTYGRIGVVATAILLSALP